MDYSSRSMTKRPVCVLSVGRSGTSLTARAINLLGVHLGAEQDMMSPSEQNERGYWENVAIHRLNEELLEGFGGSWYRPPDLTPGWAHDEGLERVRERAVAVARELAGQGRRWGFKDPRTIVLLPFWQRVVGEMDYVICVRRADAFVRSVQELDPPDGTPHATAGLWLDMNAAALRQTVGERRMFVFYEDWFEDSRQVAQRLATYLHGDAWSRDPVALDAVVAFFDPALRRADAREEPTELAGAPELEAMYAHLRLIAQHDTDDRDARDRQALVAQTLADSYRFRQALEDDVRQAEERTAASRAETESARSYAVALEQTHHRAVQDLNHQIRRRDEEVDRMHGWLDAVHASASWRLTAPLRAVKHGLQPPWKIRRESAAPASDQSLLAEWSVRRVWWLAFTLSLLVAATDAIMDNRVILIALLSAGPCCGLLTGRWVRTATLAIWTGVLAVLLCIPDEIWGTWAQLVNVGAVLTAGLLSAAAASFIERRRGCV